MSVYYVYEEDRLSLFRRSLIGIILKIQAYGRNLKVATISQFCQCDIWGFFLHSHLSMHFTGTSEQEGDLVVLYCKAVSGDLLSQIYFSVPCTEKLH